MTPDRLRAASSGDAARRGTGPGAARRRGLRRTGRVLGVAACTLAGVTVLPATVAAAPARTARVSFERVRLTDPAADVPRLRVLGVDVTEDVRPTGAVVIASSDAERRALRAAGFAPRTLIGDYGRRLREQAASRRARLRAGGAAPRASALPSGRTTYRTYDEIQRELDTLALTHPGLVRKVVLPQKSVEGRSITGVEIAANVNRDDDGRPVYVVVAEHHAREWPTAEIAVEFALDLVQHQADARIARLLANLRIVVIPVQNPDGFVYSRGTAPGGQADLVAGLKRRNCRALDGDPAGATCAGHRGVDLNRNYGAYWGGLGASSSGGDDTYRGASPWSEPEAQAFHEFTQALPVTGVQSLHNIASLVLRPPGFSALGLAPDEPKLKALGDAMAAATGYASQYGYQLYEVTGATEDWNYVAQGAFGYTIETGGASPDDVDFHGPYQTHVVDQYLGGGASRGPAGKGVREALLLAAEEAADPRDHVVVRGRAPAGASLRLRKDFTTPTSPICTNTLAGDGCGPTLPALALPDFLQLTLEAPASGAFTWAMGPSTRPFDRARGQRQTWTLTCARSGAATVTKAIFGDRGQVVAVDPCDPASLPITASGSPARRRVSVVAPGQRLADARRHHAVKLRVVCPVRCTMGAALASGAHVVARRAAVTLTARRASVVTVPVTEAGRRRLAGRGPRRLTATVTVTAADGDAAVLARTVVLRAG